MTLDQIVAMFPPEAFTSTLIGVIVGALLSAFFGFRLWKLSLVITFAATGYSIGYYVSTLAFGDGIESLGFDVGLVVGIAFAIILALLAVKIYKCMIYFAGGMLGVALGFAIPYSICTALGQETVGVIIGIVLAIILAILLAKGFMKIMKPLIIIETSLNGMALAFEAVSALIFGFENFEMTMVFSLVGLVLGIFAARAQFKMNEDRELFE